LVGGAESVVAIDSSDDSISLGKKNLDENNLLKQRVEWLKGNVFQVLRGFRDRGRQFDVIILDPPKFAQTASQADKAARGYKDINLLAFKLLKKGGALITFSCSGGIDPSLFQKIVAGAAVDANVTAQIIQRWHQGIDHPVGLNFPEGEYLKGLVIRVEK
jgi:23S rRNA (cytosine1962-C5)-methyltransferase